MKNGVFDAIEKMNSSLDPFSNIKKIMDQAFAMNHLGLKPIVLPDHMVRSMEFANDVKRFQLPAFSNSMIEILEHSNRLRASIPPLPNHLTELFESIRIQQQKFTTLFENMDKMMERSMFLRQNHSLQDAFANKVDRIFSQLTTGQRWADIEAFDEMNESFVDMSARVLNQEIVTKADLENFKKIFSTEISGIGKDKLGYTMIIIGILSFIYLFIGEYRFQTQSQTVTIEQFNAFRKEILQVVKDTVKDKKVFRTINRSCKIFLKPNLNSYIITKADSGLEIVILQSNHKWVQISFVDPQDNLTQTGWMLKKYLQP